jgi:hypothetical protein
MKYMGKHWFRDENHGNKIDNFQFLELYKLRTWIDLKKIVGIVEYELL